MPRGLVDPYIMGFYYVLEVKKGLLERGWGIAL
jgi:hypothetical protein